MVERFIGRYAVMDGTARRVTDEARKTRVATFHGGHYSAEHENGGHEGGEVHIYAHHDEHGMPAQKFGGVEGTSGIRSSAMRDAQEIARTGPRTPAELNAAHASGARSFGARDVGQVARTGPRTLVELNALHDSVRGQLHRRRA